MPIKWTAEVDQVLLLKILETSNVTADVKAISESWPSNMEKPTPRAITERLVKIRTMAKNAGASNHFSVTGKSTGTPRKRVSAGAGSSGTKKKGAKSNGQAKRKRNARMSEEDDSEDTGFKSDNYVSADEESPSKKSRTRGKYVIKLEEDIDVENGKDVDEPTAFIGDEDSLYA